MKTTPRGLALLAFALLLGLPLPRALATSPDYSVSTTGNVIKVTQNLPNHDTLAVSEPSPGSITFAAPGQTFDVDNGGLMSGTSGNISLAGVTAITVTFNSGGETINVGGFSGNTFPSLTINGGAGNDTVNFTGTINFASDKSLTVNLQNGSGPGVDAINVTGAHLIVSNNGTIDLECSQSVSITGGAVVQTEEGSLTVMANQQATPTTGNFIGVNLDGSGTKVQVTGGNGLTVNGRGGDSGDYQLGVNVSGGAQIVGGFRPFIGAVNVTGMGGASTGIVNRGVTVYGAGSVITSAGANVNVTGTAGTQGSGYGIGVSVLYGGKISGGGGAACSAVVIGTGGGASGDSNQGVEIGGAATPASTMTSPSGVTVTATAGPGASVGLYMSDAAAIGPTPSVFIQADSISLDATSGITATGASDGVGFQTIAATHIDLGGTSALGTLGLPAAILDRVNTPALSLNANGSSADITISASITRASATDLYLFPNSGGVRATASGTDLDLHGGTLFLNGPLIMPITGPNADTGFPQLNVTGDVNLGSNGAASLNLAGTTYAGSAGQTFTIIKNGGGAAIGGTFDSLPEGALLTWPGSPLFYAQISYVGGSGNDVVLTLVPASANVTNNTDSAPYSLRAAIAYARAHSGTDAITFDPSLNGATITLASQILINDAAGVTIDASTLPNGLTISGGSFVPIAATGGAGTGATFGADWLIAAIDVTSSGSGYTSSPTVTVNPLYGSPTATASASLVSDKITAINLTSGGSGYSSAPTIQFLGGGGTGATATATISNGVVSAINLTNGGSGYTSMPIINFVGGGGSGATAAVTTMSNVVGSISVVNPGAGYTYVPPVTLSGGGGSGATGQAFLGLHLASIIASGSGYAVNDVLTFAGGSFVTAAQVRVTSISTGGHVTGVSIQTVGKYNTDPAISGGNGARVFEMSAGSKATLNALTIANGSDSTGNGGGGILNDSGATLTINSCTFTGNTTTYRGGAIRNNSGTLIVNQSTFTGNSCTDNGGAIASGGTATINQCTVSQNSATAAPDGGGGLYIGGNTLTLRNSIVAGNTAPAGKPADIYNGGSLVRQGANIVQSSSSGTGPAAINADPLLAPLDNYGGPTKTMALEPGSPARDASSGSTITSDQRGFPIVGTADIGAYEAGTLGTNYNAYIWESLPAGATIAQHATTFDYDGDGVTNFNEFLAQTNPGDPTSYLHVTQFTYASSNINVTFPTVAGRHYTVEATTSLANPASWASIGGPFVGTGNSFLFTYTIPAYPEYFIRLRVGP